MAKGHQFTSETDTEVLSHLFKDAIAATDSLMAATEKVLGIIGGAYAFAVFVRVTLTKLLLQETHHHLLLDSAKAPILLALMLWRWGL